MTRPVTEFDLRSPEFKHPDTKPEDLEFRADGKIVRKDRFERGFRSLVEPAGHSLREFEIDEVVESIIEALKYRELVIAMLEGKQVVFRRLPQEDDESLRGNHWTVLQGPDKFHPLAEAAVRYEWELLSNAEELGYRIDYEGVGHATRKP